MNSGLYAACAGLLARTQALELAANNLANVNTNGYKAEQATFRSILANADGNSTASAMDTLSHAVNDFGVLGDSRADLAQGALEHTGSDFDFTRLQGDADGLRRKLEAGVSTPATVAFMSTAADAW